MEVPEGVTVETAEMMLMGIPVIVEKIIGSQTSIPANARITYVTIDGELYRVAHFIGAEKWKQGQKRKRKNKSR